MRHTDGRTQTASRERGASFVEYALLIGLFAVTAVLGVEVINTRSGEKVAEVSHDVGTLPDVEGTVTIP